ncbi:MAG: hypothetical protein HC883_01065 [Bdellovibrionaceae bacterium]|nr:hypothetical protein [Pseudobdellovibrionaceae bacterium]
MFNSERKRQLQALTFAEGQTLSRELPLDAVLKGLQIRLSGSVITTFASGTAVSDQFSTMDNLVQRIEVSVQGGRTVKSVRPYFLRQQQLLYSKNLAERKSSAAARPPRVTIRPLMPDSLSARQRKSRLQLRPCGFLSK